MGDKPARIGYRVWADGQNYFLDSLELLPHETRMIDLRKLRDAQETDFLKHTIHAGATDGSVLWLRLDNVPVMGRVAEITRHGGMASSYDCCMCACPGQYEYTTDTPTNACPIPVSINDQVTANAAFVTACGGSQFYHDITVSSSWSSSNYNIFTLSNNPKGLLRSVAAGTASALSQGPTECSAWYMMGAVCQCSNSGPAYGSTSCSVSVCDFAIQGNPQPATCDGKTKNNTVFNAIINYPLSCPVYEGGSNLTFVTDRVKVTPDYTDSTQSYVGWPTLIAFYWVTSSGGTITPQFTIAFQGVSGHVDHQVAWPVPCK